MTSFRRTAVIIARSGSTRLVNKNLLRFRHGGSDAVDNGRSLVAHKVWQLKQCANIDHVVVGSDSDEILAAAEAAGAEVRKRAPEFCDEKSRSWNDVIYDMVSMVEADIIVWAHCTNPCIQPQTYDRAVNLFQRTDGDSVVSVTAVRSHVWWNGRPLNFDPYGERHAVAAQLYPIHFQNGGIFIARRELMLKRKYVYGIYPEMFVIDADEATDVDTLEDLRRAELLYPIVVGRHE